MYANFATPDSKDKFNKDYTLSASDKLTETITKYYRINISGSNQYTQAMKIKLTGLKSGSSQINNQPTNIRLASNDTGYELGTYNAEEGSIELIRGDKDAERDNTKLFDATQTIDIYVDYSIKGEKSDISGQRGTGYYFNLNLNARIEAVGYDYYNGPEGEQYTKITLNRDATRNTREFVDNSTDMGFGPESEYGGNFEKTVNNITSAQIANIKKGNTEIIEYTSTFNLANVDKNLASKLYSYNYNFTKEDASIHGINKTGDVLNYEKSFVRYNNYRDTKYIEPILNKITVVNLEKYQEGAKIKFYKRGDVEGVNEPFFVATESNQTYTAPEGSNIKEYYAVYDISEVDEDVYWENNSTSTYWNTGWAYNKEIIGLEDADLEKITNIGRYQETVLNRKTTNIWGAGFYNHSEDWSKVQNFADGVSANVTMKFDIAESEKEDKSGKIRIKRIILDGNYSNSGTKYLIYKIGQTPGVDEPIAILTNTNKMYKPAENIEGFFVVQDIENLRTAGLDNFIIRYEYEVLEDNISDIRINLQIVSDSKTYNYDEQTNTVTSTTKGEMYNNTNSISNEGLDKNFSVTYDVSYDVNNRDYYFDLEGNTSNVNVNSVGETYTRKINISVPKAYYGSDTYRRIKNPVLYLKLAKNFEYDYESFDASLYKSGLTIDKTEFVFKNGEAFYVIYTKGGIEYYEWKEERFAHITFRSRLKPDSSVRYSFELYMSDEYENYLYKQPDSYDLDNDGETSDVIFHKNISVNYIKNNALFLQNNVKDSKDRVFTPSAVIKKGEKATMQLNVSNNFTNYMSDVAIIARLPFVGNKSIKDKTTSIGESGKEITPQFNGNIKLYKNNTLESIDNYTIGYSTDELADINSEFTYIKPKTNYTEEELQTILSAKTVIIKYQRTFMSAHVLKVEYDITIPEDAEDGKMAGQQFYVSCTHVNTTNKEEVESAPAFAIVGTENTTNVTINKSFEGRNPSATLKNIHFTINGIDNSNRYEGTTNENGVLNIEGVKAGIYEITEDTTFENYRSDKKIVFEATAAGGNKTIDFENSIKRGNITLNKKWEVEGKQVNKLHQIGNVKLRLSGTTVSGDEYSKEGNVHSNNLIFENVPYGTYEISEISGPAGWYSENMNVTVNNEESTVDFVNKKGYGNIEINKIVPEGDNASGIKFRLYGISNAVYKDENELIVQEEVDRVITIGENGIGLEEHIPLGTYTLEEIEMPKVTTEDSTESRYIPYKTTVEIEENNVTKTLHIKNEWKTGNINVTVTATEGTDLTLFKVRIHGNSSYGTEIDKEYDVPESGKILIENVPLGRYKVEEVGTKLVDGKICTTDPDGYVVTYNPEDSNTAGVKVEYSKTKEVSIHNEYSGKGIVKIVKTLEAEEDVSKAENIQFKIKGENAIRR